MTAFVQGQHSYLVPVLPDRDPDGRGRARTYRWPAGAREVTPAELAGADIDAVVLQRPGEIELTRRWTGRVPGRAGAGRLPAVYVEHNTPRGDVTGWRHPLADRDDIPLVHVTHFNAAMWDSGAAPVRVVEHGIVDPGYRYTGELETLAVCCNEPVRRLRVAGTDLAAGIARTVPVAVYGMGLDGIGKLFPVGLAGAVELPQDSMHSRLAHHRAYLHPYRWTSLGLSLLEAMHLGMPVLALAATAAGDAVPAGAGVVSADVAELTAGAARLVADRDLAREQGLAARRYALDRFGLPRFLDDWDRQLKEVLS
ncbi:MAG TPA: glycosyltransferase [Mycobacteriales bacterium]|nr:glycosyltransferase [Mycobacteriales bacterium]